MVHIQYIAKINQILQFHWGKYFKKFREITTGIIYVAISRIFFFAKKILFYVYILICVNFLKAGLCELMDCDEASSQPVICDLQRLIYVCRACLRLIVIYTIEVYPAHISPNGSKPIQETSKLAECIYDSRTLFQQILTDGLSVLQGSKTYQLYQTGVNLTKIVITDAHRAFVSCFHAFYPTG